MAAIDTSIDASQDEINGIIPGLTALKNILSTTYATKFGTSGTADGNDFIGLRAKLITAVDTITALTAKYNATQMTAARLAKTGVTVAGFRNDLIALSDQIEVLTTLIEANTAVFLSPSLVPGQINIVYPNLTGPQRAAVLSNINSITSLII